MSHLSKRRLPSVRMNDYDHSSVVKYLTDIQAEEANAGFGVCQYTHGITSVMLYIGGCYSPTQDRIYLTPYSDAHINAQWYYIDCVSGELVPYTHGATVVNSPYGGGIYSPTQDRIYFVPNGQSPQPQWHYIDCRTGAVVAYTHGATVVSNAYFKGTYSPKQNRIYFRPANQAAEPQWHYIDCNTGNVVAYTHGITGLSSNDYYGMQYSPVDDRIYFIPWTILATSNVLHYIDCQTGTVEEYPITINHRPVLGSFEGCIGGVYCPINNIIFLIPSNWNYANMTHWYYIDLNTGSLVEYPRPFDYPSAFDGGVYSPVSNKVYFISYNSTGAETTSYYLDCSTMSFESYEIGSASSQSSYSYSAGIFSPRNNRIYFIPYQQLFRSKPTIHYIQEYSSKEVSTALMASTLFNKI